MIALGVGLGVVLAIALIGGIVAVNVAYARLRARMPPAQRAREDEALRRALRVW